MNAVEFYIKHHGGLIPAAQAINAATGKLYTGSRVGQWRDGKQPLKDDLHRIILPVILPAALKAAGIETELTDEQINKLADSIMPPQKQKR